MNSQISYVHRNAWGCPVVSYEGGARVRHSYAPWLLCIYGSYAPCRVNSSTEIARQRGSLIEPTVLVVENQPAFSWKHFFSWITIDTKKQADFSSF
jgi:hypothetical protein